MLKQLPMLVALTKFLFLFKSRKIITFSDLKSTYSNDNFRDNSMGAKMNKIASKSKI